MAQGKLHRRVGPPINPSGVAMPGANAYPPYTPVVMDDFLGNSLSGLWTGFYNDPGGQFGPWLPTHGSVAGSICQLSMYQDPAIGGSPWTGTGTQTGAVVSNSGMVQVMARMDGGKGVSCVLGMFGQSIWPPEIDFYEDSPGNNTRTQLFSSVIYNPGPTQNQYHLTTGFDATQWTQWGLEWTPTTITQYLNGVAWNSAPNPNPIGANGFNQPMFLFMQIETNDGSNPDGTTPAVVNMDIDWVWLGQ